VISKSAETLARVATERGLSLDKARLRIAAEVQGRIARRLVELRSIKLPYVGDVVEPATSEQWIANGYSEDV